MTRLHKLALGAVRQAEGGAYAVLMLNHDFEVEQILAHSEAEALEFLEQTADAVYRVAEQITGRIGYRAEGIRRTTKGWDVSLICPDGEARIFRARREPRPDRVGISRALRFDVLRRDGFACRYCGRKAPDVELHVDHVEPRSGGGADDMENYVAACFDCNIGKGRRAL